MPISTQVLDGHVGLIEMQDPPHNFLTVEQVQGVAEALESFDKDPEVRCAVLAAEGRSFCAGANFADRGGGALNATGDLYAQAARLVSVATPFIAAVQGPAIGGGLGLAMTATMRVTCPEARFSANFVRLGIHHGFGLSVTLPDLLGPTKAAEVLLMARRYKGDEAVEIGLADVCVPMDELRDTAISMAREIAEGAPLAIQSINQTLRAGLADRLRAATAHEAAEQARLRQTSDAGEGARAVAERRPGNFTAS